MANGYKTIADVFSPADTMLKIQQIKQAQAQQQIMQAKSQQAQAEVQRKEKFQQWLQGQQPQGAVPGATPGLAAPPQQQAVAPPARMPAPPQQAPAIPPEQAQAQRGLQKVNALQGMVTKAAQQGALDENTIQTIDKMQKNDQDVQAAFQKDNKRNVTYSIDRAKAQATKSYTTTLTKEDLARMSKEGGGKSPLAGLPSGDWDIVENPVTGEMISAKQSTGWLEEKSRTKQQLIARSLNHPDPKIRSQAERVLDKWQQYDVNVAKAKYEALSDVPFAQWNSNDQEMAIEAFIISAGKERPRFSRGDKKSYSQFTKAVGRYKRENNLTTAQARAKAVKFKALEVSFIKQQSKLDSMQQFTGSLDKEVAEMMSFVDELERFGSRAMNIPLVKLKRTVQGSSIENKLNYYLQEISSDAGRISGAATESIAELSKAAQEKWDGIFDPNLSMFGLRDIILVAQKAGQDRLLAMQEESDSTLNEMEALSLKKQDKKPEKIMTGMPDPRKHSGRVLTDTTTGIKYRSNGQSWRKL